MSRAFFAGSYGGDDSALVDGARLECRICWWIYDPGQGDDSRQIASGTPFSALPADWSCPICSGQRDGFMLMED